MRRFRLPLLLSLLSAVTFLSAPSATAEGSCLPAAMAPPALSATAEGSCLPAAMAPPSLSATAEGSASSQKRVLATQSGSAPLRKCSSPEPSAVADIALTSQEPAVPDSVLRRLDAKLEEYIAALQGESADVKKEECDFMLEAVTIPALRDYTARKLYDHYRHSKWMGDEAVAIHLTDNWFTPGKVSFEKEEQLLDARIFADFNRASQIGLPAPPSTWFAPDGSPLSFPPLDGRFKILYFYDTDCTACSLETPLLVAYLKRHRPDADLWAVYTGTSDAAWADARATLFAGDSLRVTHAADPEVSSDFQRLYGVLQTPKLFLIGPDGQGTILGRELDVPALHMLLEAYLDEGTASAENPITAELESRTRVGSRLPALRVEGTRLRARSGGRIEERSGAFRLDRPGRRNGILLFYTEGCSRCAQARSDAREILSSPDGRHTSLLEINLDEILAADPQMARQLLDTFNLASLPLVLRINRRGTVR